jgi:signal transduction histidine kinase
MDLTEAYDMLSALREPADLLDGHFGPLTDEQRNFAQMIYDGNLKARQWIEEWNRLDKRTVTAEALALHAHKINSGLTMLLGYASLLLTETGGDVPPEMAAALSAIIAVGEQVHAAVQDAFEAYSRGISSV